MLCAIPTRSPYAVFCDRNYDDQRAGFRQRNRGGAAMVVVAVLLASGPSVSLAEPISAEQLIPPQVGAKAGVKPESKAPPELEQAVAQFNQQQYDEALESLNAAAAKYPELAPGRAMLARFFLQSNQAPMARAMLEQTVVEHPDDPEAYRMLGDIAFQERRLTEANLLFEHLSAVAAKFSGNAERKTSYEAAGHAGLAAVAEARQQWEVARQHLLAWIAKDPKNAGAHHRLGQTLFGMQKPDEAFKELQTAADLSKELPPPEITMGRLYHQTGHPDDAAIWMNKAIAQSPNSLVSRLGVAQWQWEIGELEQARNNATAALKIKPDSLEGQVLAGVISRFQKDLAAAEEYLQAAYLASPANPMAANQLALVLADQADEGKRRRALELAENNARQFNNNADIAATLGWVYLQQGRNDDAARVFKAVANSGRINADTAYFMAVLSHRASNDAEAIATLRSAIDSRGPFAYRDEAKQLLAELESKNPAAASASDEQPMPQPVAGGARPTAAAAPAGSKAPATGAKPPTAGPRPPAGASPAPAGASGAGTKAPAAGTKAPAPGARPPAAPRPAAGGAAPAGRAPAQPARPGAN